MITAEIDDQYIQGRLAIGATHQVVGLEPQWYIGTYSWYLCKILPLFIELFGDQPELLHKLMSAYVKRIFLDMSLAIDTYNVADKLQINQLKNFAEGIICSMPLGVLVLSQDKKIAYANVSLESLFNLKHEDIKNQPIDEIDVLIPIADDLKPLKLNENKAQTKTVEREMNVAGEIKNIHITYRCMIKQQDHVLVIIRDVTHERQAQEKITRFATVIEQSGESVVITDSDKKVIYTNPAFEEVIGLAADKMMGEHYFLFSEQHDEKIYHELMEKMDLREVWVGRHAFMRDDHQKIYLQTSVTPITNSEQNVINYVIISRDITQEKILEDKLREATKMEALGRLAGGIAHDFNNLLAPMMGFTEMAMQNMPADDRVRKDLEEVLKSGERGRDLVQKIFAFARKENQKLDILSLPEQLNTVLVNIKKSLPANIDMVINIAAGKDQAILADRVDVHQIFSNLCINAIHAMAEKNGQLTISLHRKKISKRLAKDYNLVPGDYFQVLVRDTGTGISDDVIDKMFEPLFTTKVSGVGAGLGLYIVHSTIKRLKGTIQVESKLGVGTCFNVYLPVYRKKLEPDAASPELVEKAPESIRYQRILLLNNDANTLKKIGRLLECLEYKVEACFPDAGMEMFTKDTDRFDLIITENYFNDINIVETIVKISKNMALLLCLDDKVFVDEIKANMIASIKKPIVPSELARILRSIE